MRKHENGLSSPAKPARRVVASKEDWTPPTNHIHEDMPSAEEDEPTVSPLEAWLGDAQFTDCFGEPASREKLENADIIGVSWQVEWELVRRAVFYI